jgi:hypothetical protein
MSYFFPFLDPMPYTICLSLILVPDHKEVTRDGASKTWWKNYLGRNSDNRISVRLWEEEKIFG